MTITEGLAKIKTLNARIEKKRKFIREHLLHLSREVDPFEKESGGTPGLLRRELQSVRDMEEYIVTIRDAVRVTNERTPVTVGSTSDTIASMLCFRREIAPTRRKFLESLIQDINSARDEARNRGMTLVTEEAPKERERSIQLMLDEKKIHEELEQVISIMGDLDGALSLLNATTMIEIPATVSDKVDPPPPVTDASIEAAPLDLADEEG